jgi:hypothetical protein
MRGLVPRIWISKNRHSGSSREPGIQAAAQDGEAVRIPGSPLRGAPE